MSDSAILRLHSCLCMEHWSKFWNAHLTETKWKNHNAGHYSTSSHRMVSVWSSASLLLVALVALGRIIRLKGSMAQSVRHPIPSPRPTVFELTRPVRREDSSFKSSMYSKRGEKAFLLVAGCYSLLAGHLPMCSCKKHQQSIWIEHYLQLPSRPSRSSCKILVS